MAKKKYQFSEREVEQLKALARCHCPDEEIAAFMGCSERTMQRYFRDVLHEERNKGKANLRAVQYRLAVGQEAKYDALGNQLSKAVAPNPTMLIWVGKQICKQSEKVVHEGTTEARVITINKLNGDKTTFLTSDKKK